MTQHSLWLLCLYLTVTVSAGEFREQEVKSKFQIAVIGGAISGSFFTKYLADYDTDCSLEITIFDPWSPESDGTGDVDTLDPSFGQGSRLKSWTSHDRTIELGADNIYEGYKLVQQMIDNDPSLVKISSYEASSSISDLGIFHRRNSPLILNLHNMTMEEKRKILVWRYNLDYYRLDKAAQQIFHSFEQIYDILESKKETSFFQSPNDVWKAVDLSYSASVSFDQYLDYIGVSTRISWWRKLLKDQGMLRDELLTALNLGNHHQTNDQMTGLAALMNYIVFLGRSFSIDGGNQKLIQSAFRQAESSHKNNCSKKNRDLIDTITRIKKRVGTIISHYERGFEIFDTNGKSMGTFDIVVLAVPLQLSGINFLCKGSLFDSSVLHDMPLNEMIDGENSDANQHGHMVAFGSQIPLSLKIPYIQIVTTLVVNGTLNNIFIGVQDMNVPQHIFVTKNGQKELESLVAISSLGDSIYKILSAETLNEKLIKTLFGEKAKIEKVKVWGGNNGGATPTFNGVEKRLYLSSKFILYDGGHGISALSQVFALYHTNAMESAVSSIEISAIGAMFVAKHLSKRLGLLPEDFEVKDEL